MEISYKELVDQLTRLLYIQQWIDSLTRVVIIEILIYNANLNLLSKYTSVVEMLPEGAAFVCTKVDSFQLFPYNMDPVLLIYIPILLYCFIRMGLNLNRQRPQKYFVRLYNYMEIIFNGVLITFIFLLLIHLYDCGQVDFTEKANIYDEFSHIILNYIKISILLFILIILGTLKFLECCKFGSLMIKFYYSIYLSKYALLLFMFSVVMLLLIIMLAVCYILNDPLFFRLASPIAPKFSFTTINEQSLFPEKKDLAIFYCFLCRLAECICTVILCYHYRIAKYNKISFKKRINLITFLYKESKRFWNYTIYKVFKKRLRAGCDTNNNNNKDENDNDSSDENTITDNKIELLIKPKHIRGCDVKYTVLSKHTVEAIRCLSKRNKNFNLNYIKPCASGGEHYCKGYVSDHLYLIPDRTLQEMKNVVNYLTYQFSGQDSSQHNVFENINTNLNIALDKTFVIKKLACKNKVN